MFWKKSQDNSLQVDYETDRMTYRVTPEKNDPVILQVEGKLARVIDISAGGSSCLADHLSVGGIYAARINLPDEFADICCQLEVLYRDTDQVCHCRFVKVDTAGNDQLHRYVLECQKNTIKSVKEKI